MKPFVGSMYRSELCRVFSFFLIFFFFFVAGISGPWPARHNSFWPKTRFHPTPPYPEEPVIGTSIFEGIAVRPAITENPDALVLPEAYEALVANDA